MYAQVSEKSKRNDARILQSNSKSSVNNINGSIQESECKINKYTTEKTENGCQKQNRNNFKNEFKNA